MEYSFSAREPVAHPVILALSLDQKKMREHILIGTEKEIRRCLEQGNGDVFYDSSAPIGRFLTDFEADPDGAWEANRSLLLDSYKYLLNVRRSREIQPAIDFLQKKYEKGNPAAKFCAMHIWNAYLRYYNSDHASARFQQVSALLLHPLHIYADRNPWEQQTNHSFSGAESKVELWLPNQKQHSECVAARTSLLPVIRYYLQRIEDWGLCFRQCKICGRYFLTSSKRYELCSKKCRTAQGTENKRQFDLRAKKNNYEQYYGSAYNYWYNRLRKLRKNKATEPERLAAVEKAYAVFKTEGIILKNEVKGRSKPLFALTEWIENQRKILDDLLSD